MIKSLGILFSGESIDSSLNPDLTYLMTLGVLSQEFTVPLLIVLPIRVGLNQIKPLDQTANL